MADDISLEMAANSSCTSDSDGSIELQPEYFRKRRQVGNIPISITTVTASVLKQ
jgi:hypothetical protein